ncbi:cytochrome C biogenesis protein CcdA [Sphingomonas oleivorans]|uniref:Cytochrome C biogenesis protein CcdA n=1 Tax=Sphingomonas oleivorans TaxID=1735121 RepID=A0A2T5G0J9_9SPHN|nr:MFS transporter [Sphingomonas oleivorans]PTQ12677.1 cytochrome C biogenesis protein CcdA [Sphingomonas oleivorans]
MIGFPRHLLWGYVAIALFMTGDGFELAFLSKYLVDLGFTRVEASLVFTVYGLVAALSAWGSGVLAEVFGATRIMRIGAIAWIVLHILFLSLGIGLGNYPLILFFYGVRAIAYPLFIYAFVVRIAQAVPKERLASAMGWYWAMYSIGIGCLGTYLPSFTLPLLGYFGTLWLSVVWVAAAAVAVWTLLPPATEQAGAPIALDHRLRELARGATILIENRSILIAAIVRIICNLTLFGFPVIMPLYLTSDEIGFTMSQWLRIWGAMFFVTIFTNIMWGWMGDRFGWLRQMRWFGCIGCAIATLAFYYLPLRFGANMPAALAMAALLGIAVSAFVPMGAIFPAMAPNHRGAAISAHNLAAGLSNFLGPAIATVALPFIGFVGVVWIYAGLYLLGAVLTLFIHVDQPGIAHAARPKRTIPSIAHPEGATL